MVCFHRYLCSIDAIPRWSGEARRRARGNPLQRSSNANQGQCGDDGVKPILRIRVSPVQPDLMSGSMQATVSADVMVITKWSIARGR